MAILRNGKNTTAPIKAAKSQRTGACDGKCKKLTGPLVIDGLTWIDQDHYFYANMFYIPDSPKHMEYFNIIHSADGPTKVKLLALQEKGARNTKTWAINNMTDARLLNDVIELYKDLEVRKDWRIVCDLVVRKANAIYFQTMCSGCQNNLKRLGIGY